MRALVAAAVLAAPQPGDYDPSTGKGPEWGKAAPIGLLVILLMAIAVFFRFPDPDDDANPPDPGGPVAGPEDPDVRVVVPADPIATADGDERGTDPPDRERTG